MPQGLHDPDPLAHLQHQPVSDHGDEFAVGGLSLGVGNRVAEEPLQSLQIAPIPCHFNGVADSTFHAAGRCGKSAGNFRIQHLGNGVDDFHHS